MNFIKFHVTRFDSAKIQIVQFIPSQFQLSLPPPLLKQKKCLMKFVSYLYDGHDHLALMVDGLFYDMENLHPDIPNTMGLFLQYWDDAFPMAFGGELMVKEGRITDDKGNDPSVAELIAPVPFPSSFREAFSLPGNAAIFSFSEPSQYQGPGWIGMHNASVNPTRFHPAGGRCDQPSRQEYKG